MINLEKELKDLSINDEIYIPNSLRRRVNETYEQLEEKVVVNNKIIKLIKTASVIAIMILCTNFVVPTFAEEIPLIGPVLKILNNKMGINIRYTYNGLVVKESFTTENYKVNFETVDYDGENLLLVYKVAGINRTTPWPCTLAIDIQSDDFIIDEKDSMATGGIESGEYYGYQQYAISIKEGLTELNEVKVQITPKILSAGNKEENFISPKKISLTIKNRKYR